MIRPYSGKSYSSEQLHDLVRDLEKIDFNLVHRMKQAFQTKTFSYGTSGKGGGVAKVSGMMANAIKNGVALKKRDKQGRVIGTTRAFSSRDPSAPVYSVFQAGVRQTTQRSGNLQMMDMFYGDAEWGGNLGDRADPDIMAFVMYATKLKFLPGWEQLNTWPVPFPPPGDNPYQVLLRMGIPKGYWDTPLTTAVYGDDDWGHRPMSATKEISRIIRWGVGEFGGTIIFEGAEVYYDQVFNKRERLADTDLEARVFFQYFTPGLSEATFGRAGKVIFHWHGKPTVPSKLLFLTSWNFNPHAAEQWYKLIHPDNFAAPLARFKDKRFTAPAADRPQHGNKVFQRAAGTSGTYRFGAGQDNELIQEKDITAFAVQAGISYFDLWSSFATFPPGLNPWTVAKWLQSMS